MVMKCMLIEADFTHAFAHIILINKILWVDAVVSKGAATWSSDKKTKDEYEAMAWYQLDEVKDLIKAISDRCDNLIAILWFGHKQRIHYRSGHTRLFLNVEYLCSQWMFC